MVMENLDVEGRCVWLKGRLISAAQVEALDLERSGKGHEVS